MFHSRDVHKMELVAESLLFEVAESGIRDLF